MDLLLCVVRRCTPPHSNLPLSNNGPALPPLVTSCVGPDDRTLLFESRFESGNLRRAVQAYEFEHPGADGWRGVIIEL